MLLYMYLYIHLVWFCNEPNTHPDEFSEPPPLRCCYQSDKYVVYKTHI